MTFKCRSSAIKSLMSKGRNKGEPYGATSKSAIRDAVLFDLFGYQKDLNTQAIRKGLELEDEAISIMSRLKVEPMTKNTERRENDFITGECDILGDDFIRDTKCSFSVHTHPWTHEDAQKKVKEAGYDWQGQGYMWLWDKPVHYVDFILLPTPADILGAYDDFDLHIDMVNKIPLINRIQSVKIERDEAKQKRIEERVTLAQPLYEEFTRLLNKDAS